MRVAQARLMIADGRRLSTVLADLGVNPGRAQTANAERSPRAYCERRVLIDVQPNGDFTVYSDPEVQVLCCCAHVPEDQLVQVCRRPIPENWLGEPVGHC